MARIKVCTTGPGSALINPPTAAWSTPSSPSDKAAHSRQCRPHPGSFLPAEHCWPQDTCAKECNSFPSSWVTSLEVQCQSSGLAHPTGRRGYRGDHRAPSPGPAQERGFRHSLRTAAQPPPWFHHTSARPTVAPQQGGPCPSGYACAGDHPLQAWASVYVTGSALFRARKRRTRLHVGARTAQGLARAAVPILVQFLES